MSAVPPSQDDDRTVMPERLAPSAGPSASSASGNSLPMGTQLGEFEITGLVGEGGFGIVYLAYDHSLHRKIALKEYMPSALAARTGAMTVSVKSDRHAETFQAGLKSFINEARLLARFEHTSLVKVYRFWEANGTAYMVMPFYDGVTLKEALRRLGTPPDEDWLKDLLRPLLDALALMHREQCFHRDIAPDNILILADGRPVLLDFGAARRVIGDMTQALTVILKPGYAPVEQYAEIPDMKQGAWTDIYALAAVVYFAITGKPPITSVARMLSDRLAPLAEIAAGRYSETFLRGIDQALSVKPEGRPQNVAQLRSLIGLGERRQGPRAQVPGGDEKSTSRETTAKAIAATSDKASLAVNTSAIHTAPPKRPTVLHAAVALVVIALLGGIGAFFLLRYDGNKESAIPPTATTPSAADKPAQPEPREAVLPQPQPEPKQTTAQPAVPAAAEKMYSPGLALDEIFEGRDRSHVVTVSVEKPQVVIGKKEKLSFRVSSAKPGYVYVLVVGTNREDFILLFPNDKDKDNRIKPNIPLQLPRPSTTGHGPPGTNQFVAMVSDQPRDFTIARPVREDIYKRFSPELSAKLYRSYSGPPPLFAGKAVCAARANCSEAYGAAVFSIEEITATAERPVAAATIAEKPSLIGAAKSPLATADPSSSMEADASRCSHILQRASLGDSLTAEEQTMLKRDCK